jgi:hypothetical protein
MQLPRAKFFVACFQHTHLVSLSVQGYIQSTKKYSGKVSLASLASSKSGVKNKPLELGMYRGQ